MDVTPAPTTAENSGGPMLLGLEDVLSEEAQTTVAWSRVVELMRSMGWEEPE